MSSQIKTQRAFTLVELVTVVVVISALATLALNKYDKIIYKSRVNAAIMNLNAIYAAVEMLQARNELPAVGVEWNGLAVINANLGLNLIPVSNEVYSCEFIAFVNMDDWGWFCCKLFIDSGPYMDGMLHFHAHDDAPAHCGADPCPTIPAMCDNGLITHEFLNFGCMNL